MSDKQGFWSKLGGWVADAAPLLGGAIGGPGGAALGGMIASAFGGDPNDPEDLMSKVQADPQAAVKLREIELHHKARLEEIAVQRAINLEAEDTKRIQAVNETMRAEAKSEHWMQWAWRPTCGFSLALGFVLLVVLIGWMSLSAISENRPELFSHIPGIVSAFTLLFGSMAAVVGVTAWHRGQEKRIKAGDDQSSPIVNALVKKLGG